MTTILATGGKLTADRRKVVNYHNAGIVGVRDEAKLGKAPFCIYGISGFESTKYSGKDRELLKILERLALIFGLSYFCRKVLPESFPFLYAENALSFIQLQKHIRLIRDIVGDVLGRKLKDNGQNLLAMDLTSTVLVQNSAFSIFPNQETALIGSGFKLANILIDRGMAVPEIYCAIRASGCPTGVKLDTLVVSEEIQDLFPPVASESFLINLVFDIRAALDYENKLNIISEKTKILVLFKLTQVVAGFMSLGELKNGVMHFSSNPIFDFKPDEAKESTFYKRACELTKYKPLADKSL